MARAKIKHVYFFGNGKAEGKQHQRELLGGKGAGLAEMTSIGLPVPAGFTITTDCCEAFNKNNHKWPSGLDTQVREHLRKLERSCGKKYGDPKDPLLLSVRSGAAKSMPGMMETILNLGLNDDSVEGLATVSGDRRFAMDAYRRFIMMYGNTARGIDRERFEEAFDRLKEEYTRARLGKPESQNISDTDVNEEELQSLINTYKSLYRRQTGDDFPQDPFTQLVGAINAVFGSWMSEKALTYRRVEKIVGLNGTAVNVMQMVFGNMGEDSGTGVCFTRDPSTGENVFYGDLLINAQGEDVVAGIRTPMKLIEMKKLSPDAYEQLEAVRVLLELHYKDMQDLEFTFERGRLYMLQCRTGKRSPQAAFRIAVDQATKPLLTKSEATRLSRKKHLSKLHAAQAIKPVITKEEAVRRICAEDIERLFYPVIDAAYSKGDLADQLLGQGINAVPGAACGRIVFSAAGAEKAAANNEQVILVRKETNPEDVAGMHAAQGILTATGGKTSHAAVVARGWGKCCIVGCDALRVDYGSATMTLGGKTIAEGDYITLNGTDGSIYSGRIPLVLPEMADAFHTFMKWCDDLRQLKVRSNVDTPRDAEKALEMGAEGIGLCRTEHMFFDTEEKRLAMQEMILADSEAERRAALDKLEPFQRDDFLGIFQVMAGRPVTIRLIDPPLHEFLPKTAPDVEKLSKATGIDEETIKQRTVQLHESNPMLGHRGCRLCITYPEILEMQVTAIIEAAIVCQRKGVKVHPEIMIPLTIDPTELGILVERTRLVADRILQEAGERVPYTVGTMIETPRAALLGDRLAETADFFSFGTNDLTQTTMALSRDDAGRFLVDYLDAKRTGIFQVDPFQSLDIEGVGMLVRWGIERGRETKPNLKIGICGEHGGDVDSIKFCHQVGMDYVSCSPYRVPVARLGAAQAALAEGRTVARFKPTKRRAAAKAKPVRTTKKKSSKKTTKKATGRRPGPKGKKRKAKKTTSRAKASRSASKKKKRKASRR